MNDEPRQLKLTSRPEGEVGMKREKKEKEPKANKWVVVLVLLVTVMVTLVFYFSGGRTKQTSGSKTAPLPQKNGLFGPKIYQF